MSDAQRAEKEQGQRKTLQERLASTRMPAFKLQPQLAWEQSAYTRSLVQNIQNFVETAPPNWH